eukprot:scpid40091/ scgid5004/ 
MCDHERKSEHFGRTAFDSKSSVLIALLAVSFISSSTATAFGEYSDEIRRMQAADPPFRPPAVPLVVTDPYMSMWSRTDDAYEAFPSHWAGAPMPIVMIARVDGKPYMLVGTDTFTGMCDGAGHGGDGTRHADGNGASSSSSNGEERLRSSTSIPNADQTSVLVLPTTTLYVFEAGGVQVNVTFSTPTLPPSADNTYGDISRGTTYITASAQSSDGKIHSVEIYYENTAEITVDDVNSVVEWSRMTGDDKNIMRVGAHQQNVLGAKGDRRRISWGYFYATPDDGGDSSAMQTTMTAWYKAACAFTHGKALPDDDTSGPRKCNDNWPVLAVKWDLGQVTADTAVSRHVLVFLDDIFSIDYFGLKLPPYWRYTFNSSPTSMIHQAMMDYESVLGKCKAFDEDVVRESLRVGGMEYAFLTSLTYRQVLGAMKIVYHPVLKEPWAFMMEMSTDGDVSTIDVIFPASSQLLYFSPELLTRTLLPLLAYSNNETNVKYNLNWAPHHLGTWPICDLTPERQEQMPMEESANMLLMLNAIAQRDTANFKLLDYIKPYFGVLETWANFIFSELPMPPKQLCTDDFEGPEANNTNLAVKGILGLEAMAGLMYYASSSKGAEHYRAMIPTLLSFWMQHALASDQSHYKREYNLDDSSFSLKYNLLYQLIMNVSVFDPVVFQRELTYYVNKQSATYGIPLNDRASFQLTEYQGGLLGLAYNMESIKTVLIHQLYSFADQTPSRDPFGDRYDTVTGKQLGTSSFIARATIGEIFSLLLVSPAGVKSS